MRRGFVIYLLFIRLDDAVAAVVSLVNHANVLRFRIGEGAEGGGNDLKVGLGLLGGKADVVKGKDLPDWFVSGAEAALLAPTAMNRQPFTLSLEKKDKVALGKASGLDKGIVKYNFEVGAAAKGCKKVSWK